MSKIANAFKDGKAFIAFLTGGDPTPEKTVEYILTMEKAGADLIEIGIPFSDPTAEGVVIQDANIRALKVGTTTDKIFEIVKEVRKTSQIPLVFLTYLNPVFHYGYDAFFKKCKEYQVDGLIIPDLPYEEKHEVTDVADRYGVGANEALEAGADRRAGDADRAASVAYDIWHTLPAEEGADS